MLYLIFRLLKGKLPQRRMTVSLLYSFSDLLIIIMVTMYLQTDTNQPNINDAPTLPQLDKFPIDSDGEELRIIREIGKEYIRLGTHLLDDATGARTEAIEHEYQKDAIMITYKIFQLWLQGSGKVPISWATLIQVLKTIERTELARKIEKLVKNSDLLKTSDHLHGTYPPTTSYNNIIPLSTHLAFSMLFFIVLMLGVLFGAISKRFL